jgi:phage terminase large subunit
MTPAQRRIKRWREDPVTFVTECLGVQTIDPWQLDTLRAFPTHQRLAMKACKGPGKTCVLAWCAWNFLATRTHPKVAATSITSDNLSDGLWTEMAKWQHRHEFLKQAFAWTKTRIVATETPETWWMSARTWPKGADSSQQADTLAGLHADNLLFILDEAGGIPDAVMAAAEAGLATGGDTKILMAGNPTHLEGPLYRATTTERHLWWLIEITADPDDPKRTPRVSVQWAREQIQKYGIDNPWVLVNVFGKFPPTSLNALLGPDEVAAAMRRSPKEDAYEFAQKRLGIDVARFGDDSTVIFPRQGIAARNPVVMRNARSHEIAARVIASKVKWGSEIEFVDGTGGYGAGVIDSMIQGGYAPIEVHFSGKPIDPRYLNKRAEMWFLMAEWVKRGGTLPNDPELQKELTAPTYTFTNGKFRLEEKDQIKERLGFSPDKADALALTFAQPEMPANLMLPLNQRGGKLLSDYDPYADVKFEPGQ